MVKEKSRSQKAMLNMMVLFVYEIISFICSMVLPRLILEAYGSEYNGITTSITQFLYLMLVLRMGVSGPTRVVLYKALAEDNKEKISGVINATQSYMRKLSMILLGYIVLLSVIYPFISNTTISGQEAFILVLVIGLGSFAEYFWGITPNILLMADQSQYVYYTIQSISTVISTISACLLIKLGASIIDVKICSSAFFVITPLLLGIIVKRRYKINKAFAPDKSGLEGRRDAMALSIANIIHSFTGIVVLTLFTDIKIVSVYTIYFLVFNAIKKIMTIFTTGLEGGFGNMLARNEIENANKVFDIYEFLTYLFCSFLFSCTMALILPFVGLYTKGINDVNYIVPLFAILATIAQLVMSIRQPYITIVQAAGHYKQTKNGAIVEASINILTSVSLTKYLGLVGVILGSLAANVFRTVQYVLYLRKNILKRDSRRPLGLSIWTIGNIILVYMACMLLHIDDADSWYEWIVKSLICVTISCVTLFLTSYFFYKKELRLSMDYLMNMIKRRIKK